MLHTESFAPAPAPDPAGAARAAQRALDALKEARAGLAASETKLANLQPLSEDEQHRYDTLDAPVLEEKQQWLSKQLEAMVEKKGSRHQEGRLVVTYAPRGGALALLPACTKVGGHAAGV